MAINQLPKILKPGTDSDSDMLLHFAVIDTGIECGDDLVELRGHTLEGIEIRGSDTIRTVGCP